MATERERLRVSNPLQGEQQAPPPPWEDFLAGSNPGAPGAAEQQPPSLMRPKRGGDKRGSLEKTQHASLGRMHLRRAMPQRQESTVFQGRARIERDTSFRSAPGFDIDAIPISVEQKRGRGFSIFDAVAEHETQAGAGRAAPVPPGPGGGRRPANPVRQHSQKARPLGSSLDIFADSRARSPPLPKRGLFSATSFARTTSQQAKPAGKQNQKGRKGGKAGGKAGAEKSKKSRKASALLGLRHSEDEQDGVQVELSQNIGTEANRSAHADSVRSNAAQSIPLMAPGSFYSSGIDGVDPFQTVDRFWRRLLAACFLAMAVLLLPNYHDVMPPAERNAPFSGFGEHSDKPWCGWDSPWFLADRPAAERVRNRHACMRNVVSLPLLAVARVSAIALYLSLTIVMASRMRFSLSILQCTALGEWLPFHKIAELHNEVGIFALWATVVHGAAHAARYACNGDVSEFFTNAALSGYASTAIMLLIAGGMARTLLLRLTGANLLVFGRPWETKYAVHMSWVFFAVAMFYHRHRYGVYWLVMLCLFAADRLLERFYGTIRALEVELLACGSCGTMIRFAYHNENNMLASRGVEVAGSIVRVCMPGLSKLQWHPFSAMYDPYDARFACVYIAKAGDWTTELYNYSLCHSTMPWAWVAGPLFSEFSSALQFRDIVIVCSGAAITPVLGLAQYYDATVHRVTLLWIVRDAELISYLLPICNPATKIVVYFTDRDHPHDKIAGLTTQKFFSAPQLNPKQQLGVSSRGGRGSLGPDGDFSSSQAPPLASDGAGAAAMDGAQGIDVMFGRPKNWDAILDEHIAPDMRGETCVAISSGVTRMANEVEELCVTKGIARVRSDATFGW